MIRYLSKFVLAGACALAFSGSALAREFVILHTFKGAKDGARPESNVTLDAQGNLYGTTYSGGAGCSDCGTVFRIAADGTFKTLHAFSGGSDGAKPVAGLTLGPDGAFYGATTIGGGDCNCGTVFRVTSTGKETVIHAFERNTDGANPAGGVAFDKHGNLFGTTRSGGSDNCGTLYEISAQGDATVPHNFHDDGHDGCMPTSKVVFDREGNLFGAASVGGDYFGGAIFKFADGNETTVYSFKETDGGYEPSGDLVIDKKGNLYGTTAQGGDYDGGTVFKLSPDGVETVMHSFAGSEFGDGYQPNSGVVSGPKGRLYGVTSFGGVDYGTVFQLRHGREVVLHRFDGQKGGRTPKGALTIDAAGYLFGTTSYGGYMKDQCAANVGCGTVFRLTP